MLIYVSIIMVTIIIIIYYMPLRLIINYKRKDADDILLIKLQLFFVLNYTLQVPVIKLKKDKENKEFVVEGELKGNTGRPLVKEIIDIDNPFNKIIKLIYSIKSKKLQKILKISIKIIKKRKTILKKINCEKITWKTQIGLSTPLLTGISVGNIWFIKNWFYRFLYNNMKINFNKPDFEVSPDFEENKFEMIFYCIFKAGTGHVINIGIRLLLIYIFTMLAERKSKFKW